MFLPDTLKSIVNFFLTPVAVVIVLISVATALVSLYDLALSQATNYLPGALAYASPLDTWVSPAIAFPISAAVGFFLLTLSD